MFAVVAYREGASSATVLMPARTEALAVAWARNVTWASAPELRFDVIHPRCPVMRGDKVNLLTREVAA